MSLPKVLVVGSTNMDMVIEVPGMPEVGETIIGRNFRMTPGGKGANQAVAAARAGAAVTLISAVGADAFGKESLARFGRDGIETKYIEAKSNTATGIALIMVDGAGENIIAVDPGANALIAPSDIEKTSRALRGARAMVMQLEIPMETVIHAAAMAAEVDCPVVLNPAPMPPDGLPDLLLRNVAYLVVNEGELHALVPEATDLVVAATQVMARGPQVVIVTQGSRGATLVSRDETIAMPPPSVHAIDTVGAGDCFIGALAVALAERRERHEALRFAVVASALSTTRRGAQTAMPTREEIEAKLA